MHHLVGNHIFVTKLSVVYHVHTCSFVNVHTHVSFVTNVGVVSVIVNVALAVLSFHKLSLTVNSWLFHVHHTGTCAAVTLNVDPHHVQPPKFVVLNLYALLAVIHAHHTSTALALQLVAVHSGVLVHSNVIVGPSTS